MEALLRRWIDVAGGVVGSHFLRGWWRRRSDEETPLIVRPNHKVSALGRVI